MLVLVSDVVCVRVHRVYRHGDGDALLRADVAAVGDVGVA